MAIYRGIELEHWREKFEAPEGSWHVQAFLHYVDANGPHSEWEYDKRISIGHLNNSNSVLAKKSYIQITK